MTRTVAEEVRRRCQHCDGPVPCKGCSSNVERPGVTRKDNTAEVTLPVGADRDRIQSMLTARGLDPADWLLERVTVNEWEGFHVDAAGNTVVVALHQTKAYLSYLPKPEETPWGRFLEGLRNIRVTPKPPLQRLKGPVTKPLTWAVFGDDQAPFVNWPLHELLCEMFRTIQPDGLLHMGDLADLPDISRHKPRPPESDFAASVLKCIDVAHQVQADRVEAAGDKSRGRRLMLRGNHDARFDSALLEKLPQLFGLRRAATDADPDPAQLLTVHHLARLTELGFAAVSDPQGDYPYGTVQLADELLATHGWKSVRGAGNTARSSIEALNSGIVVGHTHRAAIAHETRWSPQGEPQVYTAAESGTLADPRGLGYTRYPDWQPGFLTVTTRSDGSHHVDLAIFRGDTLRWRDMQWQRTARGVRQS